MSLFDAIESEHRERAQPLAARMRPRNLEEFVGQQHFLGPDKLLRRLLSADRLGAVIFSGPPGTGKTTLARILANETGGRFHPLNALASGVKEIREVLDRAAADLDASGQRSLVFIDEIHRLNRAQQDVLLADVEEGRLTLIGATTANPFFAISRALISRSQIFEFHPLEPHELIRLLDRAIHDTRGLASYAVRVEPGALETLAELSDGDARRALNALEVAVLSAKDLPVRLTSEGVCESVQRKAIDFDPTGDTHYDLASALIKSIRGSDPDASLYWLARMLESGEEIRFICRRLVILASEDVGNADPHALPLAVSTMQACEFVGLPECQLNLSQAVIYLACAPKSNASTLAIGAAREDVRQARVLPVPSHLRDAHFQGAKQLGRGVGYQYAHDAPGGVAAQDYLGVDRVYYRPTSRGWEAQIGPALDELRQRLGKSPQPADPASDSEESSS
jgi:putative ATPase